MRTNGRRKPLTFGEFIMHAYDVWGRRKAGGMVRVALEAQLIKFRRRARCVVLKPGAGQQFLSYE